MKLPCRLVCLMALTTALFAGGCALPPTNTFAGASSGRSDLVTESDEPAVRRRARLRLELAAGYFEQGQTNVALDEIKQSLVIDPTFVDAYNMRGLVYMRLNDVPLAEDSFRRALALNPRDADVAHNFGWMLCQQARYDDSSKLFSQANGNPTYTGKAKTFMTQGVCQLRAGKPVEAEQSLIQSYDLDPGNPVTAYNLANLLYDRSDFVRAQFYVRRLNNSDLANAETLWLGIRTERKLTNPSGVRQLGDQLKKRFPQSAQAALYERGAFSE
jgi:type IV pilus assembly protein PilF